MTLPMDMKNLTQPPSATGAYFSISGAWGTLSHPKAAPEPSMYWPMVLMTPLGPAPNLKMETVPGRLSALARPGHVGPDGKAP